MLKMRNIRRMFEAHVNDAQYADRPGAGRMAFLGQFLDTMGCRLEESGQGPLVRFHTGGVNNLPYIPANSCRPAEVSLRHLAEAIMGHNVVDELFDPQGGFNFTDRRLMEAAIDPSELQNVSTFNLAVAGLVNAQILEKFSQPAYIGRQLLRTVPTRMNGQKFIGVGRMPEASRIAQARRPGERHAQVGFGDQYKTSPETYERALSCWVTKEAVFFDLTSQVLEEAGAVGDSLSYTQEKDIADMVLGVPGLPSVHSYNGTAYETYQTASPWINDIINPFTNDTDIDEARQLFVGMVDPSSGKEILVNGTDLLVMPGMELTVRQQLFGVQISVGTDKTNGYPGRVAIGAQPMASINNYTVTTMSAIWYNRALAPDGLNLSAVNAKGLWLLGDYTKAFCWMENWPLTPWQASADELTMKDQGLVAVYGANYRGTPFVYEPRYVERNRVA